MRGHARLRGSADYSLSQAEIKMDGTIYVRRYSDGRNRHIQIRLQKRRATGLPGWLGPALLIYRVDKPLKAPEWVSEQWFRENHLLAEKESWEDHENLVVGEGVTIVDHPCHSLPMVIDGKLDKVISAKIASVQLEDLFSVDILLITKGGLQRKRLDVPYTVQLHKMQLTRTDEEPGPPDPDEGNR